MGLKIILGSVLLAVSLSANAGIKESELNVFLEHLVSRKGVCLAKVKEFSIQGAQTQGLNEASQCLNTIAYELIPLLATHNPNKSMTLQLKSLVEIYQDFVKDLTICPESEISCETIKTQAALKSNIKLISNVIEQLVMNIGNDDIDFDNEQWLVQWDSLNEIMQG